MTHDDCPTQEALRAECAQLRRERDEADALLRDTFALIERSTRWISDATRWESDEDLGPEWQALYNRVRR